MWDAVQVLARREGEAGAIDMPDRQRRPLYPSSQTMVRCPLVPLLLEHADHEGRLVAAEERLAAPHR
jgi:hypothetical protein